MRAIVWEDGRLRLLDQRYLPHQSHVVEATRVEHVAHSIRHMVVRGAPAIAISAAYGMALAVKHGVPREEAHHLLLNARPTAVNLRWALKRLSSIPDSEVEQEAIRIHKEDLVINHALAEYGSGLLQGNVITICNTGSLATAGHGTALGMIHTAHKKNRNIHVYALETRPYLQGSRLTTYECQQSGIPCTLITDGMAAYLMQERPIHAVVIGCDRVARNGDTANKIGSYSLAVLARHHKIPFYVAMPTSTFDARCTSGQDIVIEERPPEEVRSVQGNPIAPHDIPVWNPSFDVTPASLITAWVSEKGICDNPMDLNTLDTNG